MSSGAWGTWRSFLIRRSFIKHLRYISRFNLDVTPYQNFCYRAYFGKVYLLVLEVGVVDLGGAAPPPSQLEPGERVDAALVRSQSRARTLTAPEKIQGV